MEQLTSYLPQALYGLGMLLAGFGGSQWHARKNNNNNYNGKERRQYVSQHECELTREGLSSQLAEGNRRMGSMEKTLISLNDNVHTLGQGMGQLQGAHKALADTVMMKL